MGRFNSKQLEIVIQYLIARDGRFCSKEDCKKPLHKLKTKVRVDHRDGDLTNWNEDNIRLLCHSCNIKEGLAIKAWLVSRSDKEVPIELRLGSRMEKRFVEWLTQYLDQNKKIAWGKCRNLAALESNASRETIKNYMLKWTETGSDKTPFTTVLEKEETFIKYKPEFADYLLQFEDLK